MDLIPKHQQFFYLTIIGALLIMASMVIISAQRNKGPQYKTTQAAYETEEQATPDSMDSMYMDDEEFMEDTDTEPLDY